MGISNYRATESRLGSAVSKVIRRLVNPLPGAAAYAQHRHWTERLEPRVMLSVSASVSGGGVLAITADDASAIIITTSAGLVKVNGDDPSTGASNANSITHISLTATGTFDNAINFSAVMPAVFSGLTQVAVDAGGGTGDSFTGPNVAKTWNINSNNGGTITFAVGGPSFTFSNVESLTGGSGADIYKVSSAATMSGSITGGGGGDTLDYSSFSGGVTVNLKTGASTNITGGVSGIENVIGGSGADSLTGDDNDNILRGLGADDVLTPNGGRDSLFGGDGADTFNGGPAIGSNFGDLLFAKLAQLRRLIVGDLSNASFTGYVFNHDQIPFISFGQAGNRLQDVEKADVIATFYNVLHTALNGLSASSDVQQVLFTSLGTSGSGLGILADANANGTSDVDDVMVIVDNTTAGNAKIQFETPLHKSVLSASTGNPNFDVDTQLDFDLHLPGLPLASGATTHGGVLVAAGYDYALAFGVSQASGVFIDESKQDELSIDLRAKLTVIDGDSDHAIYHDPDGTFGVLYSTIEDQPSNPSSMRATLLVNFIDETTAPTVKISGEADYNLRMTTRSTSDGADAINPIFNAYMDASWTFGSGAPQLLNGVGLLGTQPAITFSNLTMDADSFFQNFVKPIVRDHIRSIFSSIDGLVEVMTYKLPVLGVSMAEVFDNPLLSTALVGNFAAFFEALEIYKDMDYPSPGGTIDLGSFTIAQDARVKNHGPGSNDFVDITDGNITPPSVDPIQQLRNLDPTVNTWFDDLDMTFTYGFGGTPGISPFQTVTYHLLQFPMLTGHAINSFHMLLGHRAELLKWDAPPLSVFYTFVVKQQLFPPGPTEVDAGEEKAGKTAGLVAFFVLRPSFQAHFAGGYDTRGFEIETPSEGYYLNGTDRSQVHPPTVSTIADDFNQSKLTTSFMRLNIDVSALVGASLPLGPITIDIGLGIGLSGVVNWDVHDPGLDGDSMKVRPSETQLDEDAAGTIYDTFGSLLFNFDLLLKISLDLGLFTIPILTRLQHLAQFKIFTAGGAIDTSGAVQPMGALDTATGVLTLNTIKTIADPARPEKADDVYLIKTLRTNTDGSQDLLVISGGRTQEFDDVKRVNADGGAGNDTFIFKPGISIPVSIQGGDGNDHLEYDGTGNATMSAGAGDDNIITGSGADSVDGGSGKDHIETDGGSDTAIGGAGDDEIDGGRGDDMIWGDNTDGTGSGKDFLDGNVGNNTITAGAGDDIVIGIVRGANTNADGGIGSDELDAQFGSNPDDIQLLREALTGGGWGVLIQTSDSNFGSMRGKNFETLSIQAGGQGNANPLDDILGRPGDTIHVDDLSGTGITTLNLGMGKDANPDHERDTVTIEGTPNADTLSTAATFLANPADPNSAVNITQVSGLPYVIRIPGSEPQYDAVIVKGNGGNDNLIVSPPVSVNEQQKIIVNGAPTGGTFTISLGNQTTAALAPTATAAQVQSALEALSNVGAGNVLVSLVIAPDGTRTYLVTFAGALAATPEPQMTTVDKKQRITIGGSPTGGSFQITYAGQTTAAIPFNATPAAVQAALGALSNVGAGNVLVTGTAGQQYDVQFLRTNPALLVTDSFTGGATPRSSVSNISTLTGGSSPKTSTQEVTDANAGRLDTKLMLTLDGGAGTDTVTASMNADYILTDTNLNISVHGDVTLASIETADLTGGASANSFTVTGWTGNGSLTGLAGNDVVNATNDVNFTLTDTLLTRTAHGDLVLSSIDTANLTGGASANTFVVSNWTGTAANLNGVGAGDTYTVNLMGSGGGVTNINDTGAAGTDSVIVNGTAGVDTFNVNGTRLSRASEQVGFLGLERLTINAGSGMDVFNIDTTLDQNGVAIVTTPLANAFVLGQDGSDTFNLKPTPFTLFDVDGGDPTPPLLPAEWPGDQLNLALLDNEVRRLSGSGTNAGGGVWSFPDPNKTPNYKAVTYRKIEKMAHVGVIVTAPGPGMQPLVRVYDAETKYERVTAFLGLDANNKAGARVATGDVNGDGIPDIIVGGGPGAAPEIRVFNGANGLRFTGPAGSFMALDGGSKAGLWLGAADFNHDGLFEIISAPDSGSAPVVRVWGVTGMDAPANAWRLVQQFSAYTSGNTGVRIAAADMNGDGLPDIITAPGSGQTPNVRVFDLSRGATLAPTMFASFNAFGGSFKGGVYVAAGDVNGDGVAEIITGQGNGGTSQVQVFNGTTIRLASPTLLNQFTAYAGSHAEVRVAAVDTNNDKRYEVLTAPGAGGKFGVRAWRFNPTTNVPSIVDDFFPYDPGFAGGEFIAGGN